MSLTLDIKYEIAGKEITEDCCNAAFLSALIHTAGSLIFGGNNKVAVELAVPAVKAEYAEGLYGVTVRSKTDNTKSETRISGERVEELLSDLFILVRAEDGAKSLVDGIDKHLIQGECCKANYIRGAFLGAGALSIIKKGGYHLQFANNQKEFCKDLSNVLIQIGIPSKIIPHGDKHLVYIKDADNISDLLALIGAEKAVLKFNSKIVDREMGQKVNRENNCFLANLDKTVVVSIAQCQAIERLQSEERLEELGKHYTELAKLRLDNPNMTYQELSEKLGISKSSVKYKLDKLVWLTKKGSNEGCL